MSIGFLRMSVLRKGHVALSNLRVKGPMGVNLLTHM